jgi:hypothetical protein
MRAAGYSSTLGDAKRTLIAVAELRERALGGRPDSDDLA